MKKLLLAVGCVGQQRFCLLRRTCAWTPIAIR